MNKLLFQLVKVIAIPFWAFQTIKRHRAVRLLIFGLIAGVGLIYGLWGSDGVATAVQLLLQLAYGFGFMILQFVGLFWFIYSSACSGLSRAPRPLKFTQVIPRL
jgi:hypothetical protein